LLPEQERQKAIKALSQKEAESLLYDWAFWARPKQLPPDWDWYIWLILSGRGFGKTRTANELVIKWASEGYSPIALIGQTKADVRDTIIELGDSALLSISPPWFYPEYEPSKRRLTWPNGVVGIVYSGDEPDQLRGPQHTKASVDELSKFKYPQETWDNLMLGLRIGDNPQAIVATTPRPIGIIKKLLQDGRVAITRGHTLENRVNLASPFLKYILDRYEGTRLGRQELAGEVLDDNPDALWKRSLIDDSRTTEYPDLIRVVVGVDPPGGVTECGIVVVGIANINGQVHGFVLEDRSLHASPDGWAGEVLTGYNRNKADRVVGEANFGGDMVENTIIQAAKSRNQYVSYKSVHASRGKAVRAEPAVALYEQGRIHHVGEFSQLEDEMCEWIPGESRESPNRVDALVWAITELMLEKPEPQERIVTYDAMAEVRDLELA